MEALQAEIVGWLGYLDRWSVSWQIAFIILVSIAAAFTRRSTTLFNNNHPLANIVEPLILMGTGLLLRIVQIPSTIVLQVGLFWALFNTVSWIESKLKINNHKNQLAALLSKIAKPATLVWAITYFIARLSSLSAISIVGIGSYSNTEFAIGNTFLLVIGLCLILATSQTFAAFTTYTIQFILKYDDRTRKLLQPLFQYLIIACGLVALAFWANFDSSTLLVIFGSISFGLGFGLQQPVLNFVTGI